MKELNIALVQSGITWHDREANLERFGEIVLSISERTDLVVLPEMFTTGFTMEPSSLAEGMDGIAVTAMKDWSAKSGADITGSLIIHEDGKYFNRMLWVKPGGEIFYYDKRHLFRMGGEHKVYSQGETAVIVELCGWRIMPLVCYDLRFPVWSRNTGLKYDFMVCCANWPSARQYHWDTLLRARAIENQCYVAGVNRTGTDGKGVRYAGGSCLVDFAGNTLCDAGDMETAVIRYTVDPVKLKQYRETFPAWMDAESFSLNRA